VKTTGTVSTSVLFYHSNPRRRRDATAMIIQTTTINDQGYRFMAKPGATGLTRIIHAFGYSMKGMRAALRYESAFRQEAVLAVVLVPVAFWLGQRWEHYIMLIGSLFLVLIVELLNSSIEAVVDRIGDERHELAGRAKDMGSAAVFISLINVLFIWAVIAYLRFMN
jgi:diacylglycerol kinase (ATP)